jgi:hypothetical protein
VNKKKGRAARTLISDIQDYRRNQKSDHKTQIDLKKDELKIRELQKKKEIEKKFVI